MQDFILNCEKQFIVHMSEKGRKEEYFYSTNVKNTELSCNAESTKKSCIYSLLCPGKLCKFLKQTKVLKIYMSLLSGFFRTLQKSSPFSCTLCSCWISAGRQHNILLSAAHHRTQLWAKQFQLSRPNSPVIISSFTLWSSFFISSPISLSTYSQGKKKKL